MGFIKRNLIEESTLGLLVEENELDIDFSTTTLSKRWRYYLISGLARGVVNLMFLLIPAILLALIKLFAWFNVQEDPEFLKMKTELLTEAGINLNVWWFLLGITCGYYIIMITFTTAAKTIRTIVSMIYYNKFLFKK